MSPPAKKRGLYDEYSLASGWYENRDPQGVVIHWSWLLKHWHDLADKLIESERRQR